MEKSKKSGTIQGGIVPTASNPMGNVSEVRSGAHLLKQNECCRLVRMALRYKGKISDVFYTSRILKKCTAKRSKNGWYRGMLKAFRPKEGWMAFFV